MPLGEESIEVLFEKLNHTEVYKIVRECISALIQDTSYKTKSQAIQSLAKKVDLSVEAIRSFVDRDAPKRVSRDNATLKPLYVYCMASRHLMSNEARSIINDTSNWLVLIGKSLEEIYADPAHIAKKKRLASLMFYDWFVFEGAELARLYGKLSGDFIICRKSITDKNIIVKSKLKISFDKDKKFLEAVHVHMDRQHIERKSYGFVLSTKGHIHIIMQIENVEGLETITLRDPLQWKFKRMQGFTTSLNIDRKIVNARIFLERASDKWEKLGPRFHVDDAAHIKSVANAITAFLDKESSQILPDPILMQDDND